MPPRGNGFGANSRLSGGITSLSLPAWGTFMPPQENPAGIFLHGHVLPLHGRGFSRTSHKAASRVDVTAASSLNPHPVGTFYLSHFYVFVSEDQRDSYPGSTPVHLWSASLELRESDSLRSVRLHRLRHISAPWPLPPDFNPLPALHFFNTLCFRKTSFS